MYCQSQTSVKSENIELKLPWYDEQTGPQMSVSCGQNIARSSTMNK